MAYRILTAAALFVALASPALANSSSTSNCYRDATGTYRCQYEYRGTSMNSTTTCASRGGSSRCETETSKPEYSPTRIMDGHGPR